jgi:futalosine hydrolase
LGDIVIATQEIYSDTGSSSPERWYSAAELGLPIAQVNGVELGGSFPLDVGLALAATDVIQAIAWPEAGPGGAPTAPENTPWSTGVGRPGGKPAVLLGTCLSASRVTGLRGQAEQAAARWGALAESMEGAAAAHVCALYQMPFLEIRGISNLVVDRNRGAWRVEYAAAVAGRAALAVAAAVDGLPLENKR